MKDKTLLLLFLSALLLAGIGSGPRSPMSVEAGTNKGYGIMGTTDKEDSEEWGKEEARNFKTTPKRPKVSSAESGSGEGSGFSRQIIAAGEGLLQKQFDKFKAPAASKLNRDVMGVTRVQTEEEAARIINEAVQERIKENTTPPPPGMPAPVPGGDMEKVQNVANKVISGTLPSVEHPEQETVGNPSIPDAIVGGGGQAGSQTNVQATGQTVTQPGQPGQNAISVQSNTNVNSDKASSETNMGVILDTNTTVSTYNITAPPPGSSIDVNMGKNGAHVMMTTVNSNNQTVDANGTYINPLYNPPDTAVTPQGTDAYNVSEVKPPQQQQPQTMPTSQPQQLQEPSQETIPTQKPSQQLQQTQAQLPQQPQETQEQAQATPQQQLATQDKQQATQGQEQETQLQQQATQVQQQATQLQQQANQQQEQATQLQQQAISQQQQAAQEQQQATNQQTQGGQAQQAAVPPPPPPPSVAPPPQPSSAPTVAQMQQPQQPWTYPQSESSTPANQSSTVSPSQSMPQQQSFQSVSNSPSPTIPAGGVVGRVNQLQGNGVPNAGQLPTPWYTQAGGVNGQPQSAASNNSVTARPSAGYTWPTITTEALRPTDYPPQVMNMSIGPTTPSGGYPISKNMNTPQTDQPTVPSTQNVGPMLSNAPGGKILIVSNTTFLIGGQGIGDKGGLSPTSNQPMAQNEASQPEVLPSINTQTQSRPTKDMFQGPESSLPTYSLPKNFTNAVYQNRPGSLPDEAVAETSVNISFPGAKPGQVVLLPKKVKNDPNEEAQLVPLVDKGKTTPQPTAPPPAHTFVPTVMGSKPTEIGTVGPTDMNQPTIIGSVTPTDHITTEMGTVVPTNPGPGLAPTPTMPTLAGDGYKIETSLRLKFGENKQLPLNMIVGDKDNTNLVKMPLGPSRERINNPMHFDEDMYQERSMAGQAVTTVTPSKPDIRPTPDPYGGIKDAILSVDISQLKPGQLLSLRLPNSHKSDLFKVKDIKTRDSSIEAFTKDEVGSHDGIQPSKRHLLYAIIEKVKKNRKYANAMKSLFTMGSRRSESESPLLIVKSALKRARIINLPKKDKSKKYTMKELERRSEEALEKMFQRNISKSTKATLHSKHSEEVEKRTLGLKHLYKKARIGRKTKKANRKGQDITGSKKTDGTFKITLKLKGESDDDSGLHVDEPPEEMNDPLFGKKKKLTFKGKFSDKKSKEDKSEEEEEEKEMGSKGGKKKGKYGKVGAGNGASQGENNNSQAGQEGGNMANGNGNQVNPQQQANTGNQVPQQSGNAGNNGDNGNIGGASNNNNNQANANTNQQMAGQGAGNTGDSPNTNQGINNTPAQENGNMGNTNQGINNNNNAIQQAGNMGNTIASNKQMSAAGVNGNTGNDNTGNVKNMTNVIIQDEKGNTIFKGPVNVATLNETVVKNGGGDKASFKLEKAGYKVEENTDSLGMAVIEKSLQKTFHPVKKTNLFKLTDHRNKRRRIRRSIEEKNQTTEENNASKRTEGTFEIELKMSDKKKKEESDEEFRDDTSKQSDKKKKMEFEGSFSDDKKEESDNIKKGSESKESFVVIKDEKGNILYKGMMDIDALKKTESDGKSEKLKIKKVDSDEPSDKEVLQDALQRVNAIRREGIAAAAKRIEGLTLELEMSDDKNAEAKIVPNDNKTNNKDSELAKKGQTKQGRKICNVFIEDAKGEVLYHGPIDISALKQTSEINPEVSNTPRKKTFPQNYANIDSPEITQAMGGSYPGVDDIMFDKGKKHRRSLELITGTPESQQDSSRADNPLPDSNADKKTDGTFKLMVEVADKDQNSDQNDAAARQIASTTHNDDDKKMTFSGTFMDDKEKGDEKKSDKKKAKKEKEESEEEESEGDKKKKKKTEENEEEEEKEKKKEKEDNEEDEDNKKKKKGENEKEEKKKKKKEENEEEDDKKKKKEENEEEEKKKKKGKGENEEEDDKKKKKENEEEDDKKEKKEENEEEEKKKKKKENEEEDDKKNNKEENEEDEKKEKKKKEENEEEDDKKKKTKKKKKKEEEEQEEDERRRKEIHNGFRDNNGRDQKTNVIIEDDNGNVLYQGPVNIDALNKTISSREGTSQYLLQKQGYKIVKHTVNKDAMQTQADLPITIPAEDPNDSAISKTNKGANTFHVSTRIKKPSSSDNQEYSLDISTSDENNEMKDTTSANSNKQSNEITTKAGGMNQTPTLSSILKTQSSPLEDTKNSALGSLRASSVFSGSETVPNGHAEQQGHHNAIEVIDKSFHDQPNDMGTIRVVSTRANETNGIVGGQIVQPGNTATKVEDQVKGVEALKIPHDSPPQESANQISQQAFSSTRPTSGIKLYQVLKLTHQDLRKLISGNQQSSSQSMHADQPDHPKTENVLDRQVTFTISGPFLDKTEKGDVKEPALSNVYNDNPVQQSKTHDSGPNTALTPVINSTKSEPIPFQTQVIVKQPFGQPPIKLDDSILVGARPRPESVNPVHSLDMVQNDQPMQGFRERMRRPNARPLQISTNEPGGIDGSTVISVLDGPGQRLDCKTVPNGDAMTLLNCGQKGYANNPNPLNIPQSDLAQPPLDERQASDQSMLQSIMGAPDITMNEEPQTRHGRPTAPMPYGTVTNPVSVNRMNEDIKKYLDKEMSDEKKMIQDLLIGSGTPKATLGGERESSDPIVPFGFQYYPGPEEQSMFNMERENPMFGPVLRARPPLFSGNPRMKPHNMFVGHQPSGSPPAVGAKKAVSKDSKPSSSPDKRLFSRSLSWRPFHPLVPIFGINLPSWNFRNAYARSGPWRVSGWKPFGMRSTMWRPRLWLPPFISTPIISPPIPVRLAEQNTKACKKDKSDKKCKSRDERAMGEWEWLGRVLCSCPCCIECVDW